MDVSRWNSRRRRERGPGWRACPARWDLPPEDRELLEAWTRPGTVRAELAQRAQIVLLAAQGRATTEIIRQVGLSRPTVIAWQKRYRAEGIAGLQDRARPSRPPRIPETEIVARTLETPPAALGVTRWSSRLLGAELGLSNVYVAKVWRRWGLQPWKHDLATLSAAPDLTVTARDIAGLYLHPPDKALMLRVDNSRQPHPPDRTAPDLKVRPSQPEKDPGDDVPHAAATLLALLELATDEVPDPRVAQDRDQRFLSFLTQVATAHPQVELHGLVHTGATHHQRVKSWLKRNPRITLHTAPTTTSWLKLVEVFVRLNTGHARRRGSDHGLDELTGIVRGYVEDRLERCDPLLWINNHGVPPPTRHS